VACRLVQLRARLQGFTAEISVACAAVKHDITRLYKVLAGPINLSFHFRQVKWKYVSVAF